MNSIIEQNGGTQDEAAPAPSPEQDFDAAVAEFTRETSDPADAAADLPAEPAPSADAEPAPSPDAAEPPAAGDQAPPAGSSQDDNIWKDANPRLREAHEKALRDANLRLEGVRGRQSASDREVKRLKDRLAELEAGGAGSQQASQEQRQPGSDTPSGLPDKDALAKLREDFPEVAGPMLALIEAQAAEINQLKAPVGALQQDRVQAAISAQETFLTEKHPDWLDVARDERFAGWIQSQPRAVQEAMQRNFDAIVDGKEAALVIGLYKAEMGIGTPSTPPQPSPQPAPQDNRRQRQIAAGRDAGRTGPSVTTGIPDDFDAAVDAYLAKA